MSELDETEPENGFETETDVRSPGVEEETAREPQEGFPTERET
jgi:hypothetical protein